MSDAKEPRVRRWARKLREHGVRGVIARQLEGPKWKVRTNPTWQKLLGMSFALRGNRVPFRGLQISVANPLITAESKAAIYYGFHEKIEIGLATRYIDRSLPTVELGGSIGVVACVVNRMLERPEEHVVVEANPRLVPTLEESRRLNGCRFEIVPAAIGYGGPTISFSIRDFLTGSTHAGDGDELVTVPTISLKKIVEDRGFDRINLVIDIEGAEVDLVEHELETLKRHASLIILETHDRFLKGGKIARMVDSLTSAGFSIAPEGSREDVVLAFLNPVADPVPTAST